MSHFSFIKTKISDLELLKKTLKQLGYSYSSGPTKVKGYKGIMRSVDLAVQIQGKKLIGFAKEGDSYIIVADWWLSGIDQAGFLQKLTQYYSYQKVLGEIQKQKFKKIKEEITEDGTIKLVLTN